MNWSAALKLGGHGGHMPPCIYGDLALGVRQKQAFCQAQRTTVGAMTSRERFISTMIEENQKAAGFEQIVQVQAKDDIVDSGALFAPPKDVAKPVAVIWIHGCE